MSVTAPKGEFLTAGSPAGSVGAIHSQLSQGYQALAKAHAAMAGQVRAAGTSTGVASPTTRLAGALANKTTTNDPGGSTV